MTASSVEDWEVIRLGDLGEALIGLTYEPSSIKPSGTLVLRSSNIQDDRLAFDDNVYVDAAIPKRIRVQDQDILICVRNGSRRLIGKSAILDRRVVGETFGAFMAVYRSGVNSYLRYFFRSREFRRQIEEHLGATINQITNASLKSFTVRLPGPLERHEIGRRLEDLDWLVAGLQRLIAKQQAIKQGMLQELLTGRTRLPGFKAPWRDFVFEDLCKKIQDGTHFSPSLGGSDYRYITSKNIGVGHLKLDEVAMISAAEHRKIYKRCDTRYGDLLLTKDGANTGNAAINTFREPISLLSSVAFIRCDHELARESYLLQYLLSYDGRRQIADLMSGNAITRLTLRKIKNLRIVLPPVDEQLAISTALGDADHEVALLDVRLAKARMVRQGMMQQLLTGRVRLSLPEVVS